MSTAHCTQGWQKHGLLSKFLGSLAVCMAARQQAFVARIKAAAVPNGVILDARMNRNNELGVVLSPRVRLRNVRPLMTSLLRQMHRAFPGQRLTVISYAPNGKPMATMRYDPYAPPNANVIYRPNF